ncbi:MerR family transcriptional regulator [Streptomyces sp. NPDC051366]|uniref:MerR family transcriptional regulator n=1 Tax=Streptomyces sp. NPDC051366 TaxID=3365652 RepID=UPI0037A26E04
MRIGEIAALVGVTTRAIRHYHHVGLLPEPERRSNGYRAYSVRDAVLLARVRRLTELGLSLDEVRDVLADDAGRELADVLEEQTAMMYGFVFVSVIETVALAFLIPWPAVHRVVLVLDVYGVLLVLAMHAACVTRPHVVRRDGSLRIRYGALFDLTVPADGVASVRVDRRYPEGRLVSLSEDGVLDLIVGSQTTVTLELTRPLPFVRPLGSRAEARTIRFHADDPHTLVAALRRSGPDGAPPRAGARDDAGAGAR